MSSSEAISKKVEFIQYHQPQLESGVYQVSLEQTIEHDKIKDNNKFSQELQFAVTGERFSYLTPKDIFAVFPPQGSLGNHSNIIPHITLNRSTLPWERSPEQGKDKSDSPWLVLLLLRDDDFPTASERPQTQVITLEKLQNTGDSAKFPSFTLEPGQDKSDKVTVIDLKKSLLESILPTKSDLAYLAHVRQTKNGDKPLGDELATVIGNRLPQTGGVSTAYLVSVENRYTSSSEEFNFQGADDDDLIRLVCLYSWRFSCIDESQTFTQLLSNANCTPSTLHLPETGNGNVDRYLSKGYVPLFHELRVGDKTVSWYRSPLTPGEIKDTIELPARVADELLRYDTNSGMFDVSYAAAWELGRLLTLENQSVALALYNWKRTSTQNQKQLQRKVEHSVTHLPIQQQQISEDPPETVKKWFEHLNHLKHIPFNYIVPQEDLLPVESIRFFRIDRQWVECLLDGAWSIGQVSKSDLQRNKESYPFKTLDSNLSGFILRSDVVSGWPGLLVDGYDVIVEGDGFIPSADTIPSVRMDRLSKNVLLCIFNGEVKTVDLHLKPETMHFGVDEEINRKELRDPQTGSPSGEYVDISWKNEDSNKAVIDINGLASDIAAELPDKHNNFYSNQFALQMIEGVQKVRFVKADVNP